MNNFLKGVIITLFFIGFIWTCEAAFYSDISYVVYIVKSIVYRSFPGLLLMVPAVIWAGYGGGKGK